MCGGDGWNRGKEFEVSILCSLSVLLYMMSTWDISDVNTTMWKKSFILSIVPSEFQPHVTFLPAYCRLA